MCRSEGFAIHPGVLDIAECDRLLDGLSSVATSRAGARHLLSHPPIDALARDRRLLALVENAIPFRVTYFNKAADANWAVQWHQDTALPLRARFDAEGWGPWSEKRGVLYAHAPASALQQVIALRVHLDSSDADNGPLRVIPGSHELGVLSDDEVSVLAHRSAAIECVVPKGGVVMMRPLIIHSSSKIEAAAKPRRVLHIEYAASLELAPGIDLARA